jgi:ribonuclease P protein component
MGKLQADRLKKRADFLRAQKGIRRSSTGLTLEICPTPDVAARDGHFRLGFTASRKVGGAVERNRAKRRLRAIAAALLPVEARERTDYVLIARPATLTRPFPELMKDLAQTLAAAHVRLAPVDPGPEKRDGSG